MDLLIVAREASGVAPTPTELSEPSRVAALVPALPHGPLIAQLLSRLALGAVVLPRALDRAAARAAIGQAIERHHAKGVLLLGLELGRELLGEGLPLVGGIRDIRSRPIAAIGQAKQPDIERLLTELCQRAALPWAPPSTRAATARSVVRTEEAEAQATRLIEAQRWAEVVEVLSAAEPLAPRGLNMLGRALLAQGDRDAARVAFERTLAADPGNGIARRQLDGLWG